MYRSIHLIGRIIALARICAPLFCARYVGDQGLPLSALGGCSNDPSNIQMPEDDVVDDRLEQFVN